MTNEIKEILKNLKEHTWLEYKEMDILLDYITNLQEAIETIKNTNKLLIQQKAQLQDDLDMLDNRIDKAIEYINKNSYLIQDKEINGIPLLSQRLDKCTDLLEILQGEDNDN